MPNETQFRFVPLPAGRELYLPFAPASAAAGGLALYAPVSRKARAFGFALELAIRGRLAPLFLREKSLTDTPATAHIRDDAIFELLRDMLRRTDITFAVYQGKVSVVRKPTILAMDADGRPLAFAKIGWNPVTQQLVEREHDASRYLNGKSLRYGRPAPLLGYVEREHSNVLLTGPQLSIKTAKSFDLSPLCTAFLQEIGDLDQKQARMPDGAFWPRLIERHQKLQADIAPQDRATIERCLETLERGLSEVSLPWILRLGDFLPWNFGIDEAADQIEVVDLEFSETDCPVGWDLFHFLAGVRKSPEPIGMDELWGQKPIRDYFAHFAIDADLVPYLQLAYCLDLMLFYRDLWHGQRLTASAEQNFEMRLHAAQVVASRLS